MIGIVRGWTTTETGGSTAAATIITNKASGVGQSDAPSEATKASGGESSTQSISTLARQLANSATRAEERDRTLSRNELAAKATDIIDHIVGDSYFRNKAKNDSEIPNTDDPELLARAKQATAFVNSDIRQQHGVKNPFAGLSNEQLSLIIYDDSGPFTINERYAAYSESYDRREAWNQKVCAQAVAEYNNTGKNSKFYKACIENYNGLPLIEQVQYPADYVRRRIDWIKTEVDSRPHHTKDKDDKSLFELMNKLL